MADHPDDDAKSTDQTSAKERAKAIDEQDSKPGEQDPDVDPSLQYRGVPVDGRVADTDD